MRNERFIVPSLPVTLACVTRPVVVLRSAKRTHHMPPAKRNATWRPPCPNCHSSSNVKTLGGGTIPKYRYVCVTCDFRWQQVPPHKVSALLAQGVSTSIVKPAPSRPSRPYRCTQCRQIKRNHVCQGWSWTGDELPPNEAQDGIGLLATISEETVEGIQAFDEDVTTTAE